MFEFWLALKYLVPKKKQLSVSLIALMSVLVISLVVWLVLVFLSVTEGIEKNWLHKLTSLNAPLRVNPTNQYYSSYYYLADSSSSASGYSTKTIGEKASSPTSDPYDPTVDAELPLNLPKNDGKDPVKSLYRVISELEKKHPGLHFQDYELTGAMMRLQLLRSSSPLITAKEDETQNFLTQVSYISSFSEKSRDLASLVLPPSVQDVNHLLFLANHSSDKLLQDATFRANDLGFVKRVSPILENLEIQEMKTSLSFWRLPVSLLPEGSSFAAEGVWKNGILSHVVVTSDKKGSSRLKVKDGSLILEEKGKTTQMRNNTPLFVNKELVFKTSLLKDTLANAKQLKDLRLHVSTTLQNIALSGEIFWDGLEISKAEIKSVFDNAPKVAPSWAYKVKDTIQLSSGVLLAKGFQDSGVKMGDRGYLSFATASAGSVQEQRIPVYVAGFYDPGIMAVGSRVILAPYSIAHAAFGMNSAYSLDRLLANGVHVWFPKISDVDLVKKELQETLQKEGLSPYWKVATYKEYDFAKDLIQQFQSDKYLFTLLAAIILIVACCNIISLLVLLVNDKKREIGILQAMGAPTKSIAMIFGFCGIIMGTVSCLIGTLGALLTLHNIDSVVKLLSILQGHDAFHTAFYGKSLPNQLSQDALRFVLIATPIISLLAGLVPALKACRLRPSVILRSE